MNINIEKYKEYRDRYIAALPDRFKKSTKKHRTSYGELDKWRGVIDFKNNWDLSSNNLVEMIDKCFVNIVDFLDTFRVFPVGMLKLVARENPNSFVAAFNELFNETRNVEENYNKFVEILEKDKENYNKKNNKEYRYYQGLHQATFYLSMKFPNKYYVYNFNSNNAAVQLLFGEKLKSGQPIDKYKQFIKFADVVRNTILKDKELIDSVNKYKDETCYDDKSCYILTTDFLFYVGGQADYDSEKIVVNINDKKLDKLIDLFNNDLNNGDFQNLNKRRPRLDKFINYNYNSYINMSDSELKSIFLKMWTIGGLAAGSVINENDCSILKKLIADLLYGKGPLKDRYNSCRENSWGFKSAAITELLMHTYPNDYMMVNNKINKVYEYLEAATFEDMNYDNYMHYLNIGKYIQKRINEKLNSDYSLFDIDYFYELINKKHLDILTNTGDTEDNDPVIDGKNIIYYGVPGCGKSYIVNDNYANDKYVRTVFYPDYTYTDFIGQIMPTYNKNNELLYKRVPGPLTQSILLALLNPNEKVTLIIEEINRGNAAAIFGDLFQLLDRQTDYPITNEFIQEYCRENLEDGEYNSVVLPTNLSIVATMNTSDQNVFTLDNAFRRRWEFVRVENKLDKDNERYNAIIAKSNITWNDFYTKINDYILNDNGSLLNNEDKRLGAYSVSKEQITNEKLFADKVLMYIWDNIAKYNPNKWFKGDIKVYDQLIDKYLSCENLLDIFVDEIRVLFNNQESNNLNE